jgi:hypothetical protein
MSIDLTGKLYRDMPEEYRDSVSKKDFKKERRSQNRMAGDALTAEYGSRITMPKDTVGTADFIDSDGDGVDDRNQRGAGKKFIETGKFYGAPSMDPTEDNIYSYDTSAFGAGSQKDPSTERLSKIDIKNLRGQGYSRADIVDYADNIGETGVITDGGAAQRLLDRYRDKIANKLSREKDDDGLGDTDPITPIEDLDPTPVVPPVTQIIENNSGDQSPTFPGIAPPTIDVGDLIPGPGTNQSNSLLQSIIQDNDINSQVYGDGNVTTINQNNAANNYGGNQYNFARIPGYYS